ncbi:MAG: TonB-dependent receptor [Bacteroidetes bacterium]|nr:MAG: TonB-dependent receptor [Bacteroidota bacterium]
MRIALLFIALTLTSLLWGQTGTLRGNILDKETGEPIIYGTVLIEGTTVGTHTDLDGFFALSELEPGSYAIVATYIGYDTARLAFTIAADQVVYEKLYLSESAIQLETVQISGRRAEQRSEVYISKVTVTKSEIKAMPSTGGEPDIAQYLQVIPGVISTGDQGGQLYIRGGSPVQNKMMLDGMTIYNPFHSIGFFSVFETEIIQSADVLTGGFGAEHYGRISAVVDISTRAGNRSRVAGLVSVSPFQAKALIEGPVIKFDPEKDMSASFILTAKKGLLDQTSQTLYGYASDSLGLPYGYTDIYGKFSLLSGNGSQVDVFGFSFNDDVNFQGIAKLNWKSSGGGFNFKLIPSNSRLLIGGNISYSGYNIEMLEGDDEPRTSAINGFTAAMNFKYYGQNSELNYGFEINGYRTELAFRNFVGITIEEVSNSTEIGGFVSYRYITDRIIIEPGLRMQFYASLGEFSFEPRFAFKFKMGEKVRFKMSAGVYSQNLISTVNEKDIVNLFVGFLSDPEGELYEPGTTTDAPHKLQKSVHGIAGFEIDVTDRIQINIEPYIKSFTQLISLNRNKLSALDPNFQTENGKAVGLDLSGRYETPRLFVWATYSLGKVTRFDGEQTYPTHFDRRHNINFLFSWKFGGSLLWEAGARWNYGSGFPFTQTQGFHGQQTFAEGLDTDVLTNNPDLGVIYTEERNGGRLPTYNRVDMSLKRRFILGEHMNLEIIASVTNVFDRENIFYFDRIEFQRVDQLPILPSLGVTLTF